MVGEGEEVKKKGKSVWGGKGAVRRSWRELKGRGKREVLENGKENVVY